MSLANPNSPFPPPNGSIPVTPPAGPPTVKSVKIPARTVVCGNCGQKTTPNLAIQNGWINVTEVDNTGTKMAQYYLDPRCQKSLQTLEDTL